jgi:hypothetical protein
MDYKRFFMKLSPEITELYKTLTGYSPKEKSMRKHIIGLLAIALFTSATYGQNTTTAEVPTMKDNSSTGIRISLVKPVLDAKMKIKFQEFNFDDSTQMDSTNGFAVGYANLPIEELGWTTNLSFMETKNDSSANIIRADGNLAYTFSQYFNVKGGINIAKFTSGAGVNELNEGVGLQSSIGLQINKNIGIDIGYTQMNMSGKSPVTSNGVEVGKADIEIKLSGLEIGLNGTF